MRTRSPRRMRARGDGIRSASRSLNSSRSPRLPSMDQPTRTLTMIRSRYSRDALRVLAIAAAMLGVLFPAASDAETVPTRGIADSRIRHALYDGDQVYRVRGFVGYQSEERRVGKE